MAQEVDKTPVTVGGDDDQKLESLPNGADDAAPIPKGTLDPVYEAKARVLNHAVGSVLPGLICSY